MSNAQSGLDAGARLYRQITNPHGATQDNPFDPYGHLDDNGVNRGMLQMRIMSGDQDARAKLAQWDAASAAATPADMNVAPVEAAPTDITSDPGLAAYGVVFGRD